MTAQVVAGIIFIAMFLLIVFEVFERHMITLGSGLIVLTVVFGLIMHSADAVFETLNLKSITQLSFWYGESSETVSGINWSTIIFILGMMIMVEGMGRSGFFRWICLELARLVHYKTVPLLICFMIIAGVLSMFIDSITVILFLASVTAELGRMLKFNPIPMIISEIFCANLGGAATMCGDPPNIIIGTALGYTFFDFVTNTGLLVLICAFFVIPYFYFCFRKELKESEQKNKEKIDIEAPSSAIKNKCAFASSVVVFIFAVALLITHAQTELSVATIGCIAAVLTVVSTLITSGTEDIKYIFTHVDYKTILFFIGLFVSVGGLEQTGVLENVAGLIETISGGNVIVIVVIILWISAIASAFVDNIPFAATMVPVISLIAQRGVNLHVLAWTLSVGTDIGGNATPIGASANVVGTSVAAKEGHPISWGKYCKYCVPATVLVITVSMIYIFIRYNLI
ncbi:MAG: SLC13 family permease [Clostridia bacterium]|nr:SLC13 family permease [Clostridia bacterium]